MFSSKSRDEAAIPPAVANQAKRGTRSAAPSIISGDLVVTGALSSTGDIQIDGRVEGDVRSTGLVIGDKAFIQGDVMGEDVTVRGRVQGNIRARKVLLCSTCHVEGNILHEAFAVEAGAFFEGNCRHSDNPLADDAGKSQSFQSRPAPAAPLNTPAATTMASTAQMTNGTVKANEPRPVNAPVTTATFAPMKT
jgi:cytoskeletal protein CcmA (bactofilin family)